jgi:NAD(P)-dependent dehydrogenase (short-subunit alcohol dehydrogenase family)
LILEASPEHHLAVLEAGFEDRHFPHYEETAVKTWLITGASRGIGRALVERLLERGDRVAATMRDPGSFAVEVAAPEGRLWTTRLDVTSVGQVRSAVAAAFESLGRIDVVISNAGYGVHGAAEEATDAQVEDIIATNLTGSINVARAVTPYLRAQGGGRIIQVSSMSGHIGRAGSSLYCATKWGVEGFFDCLAQELAPFDVKVNLIAPGRFATTFYDAAERATVLPAYAEAGVIARIPDVLPPELIPGDPQRLVDVVLDVADNVDSPLRTLLGSDCFTAAQDALEARLAALKAQRDLAYSTDRVRQSRL